MTTSINEVLNFIDYTVNKNFFPTSTAGSRRTACKNLFSVLDENEQTVEYIKDNLDLVAHRFNVKNKSAFTGQTVETYKSRVKLTLDDFTEWNNDKSSWEKKVLSKARSTIAQPNRENVKPKKTNGAKKETVPEKATNETLIKNPDTKLRQLSLPLRPGLEIKIEIPMEGLTTSELKRLGLFLLPYCSDISAEDWQSGGFGALIKN